jgi:hypothetical protein
MKTEIDERIASLLNADAPPERDPVFRIEVLERRERRSFQRLALTLVGAALILIAIASSSYRAGAGIAEAASLALLSGALASALFYVPVVAYVLRHRGGKDGPPQKP